MHESCPVCNNGKKAYTEHAPDLTIISYHCGHRQINAVVNETISIQEYVDTDLDTLYQELGSAYLGGALTARVLDMNSVLKRGKERFEKMRQELFNFLCVEHHLCEKIRKLERLDLIALVLLVRDLIMDASFLSPLISVGLISRILVKNGITTFCKCP